MSKNQKFIRLVPLNRVYTCGKFFALAAFTVMLLATYPFSPVAASGFFDAVFAPQIGETVETKAKIAVGGGTGSIEICIGGNSAGLDNRVFQFTVTGVAGTFYVPFNGCSQELNVPVGMATITELSNGIFMNQPGTFSGGFLLTGVETIRQSPNSSTLGAVNPGSRTATINVVEGGVAQGLVLRFNNIYAASGFVEVCNNSPGDTGFLQYRVAGVAQNFVVPPGTCSAPIQVNFPATFGAPSPATGTVRITQLSKAGVTLESATADPFNRFNSLTLGFGINDTNYECVHAPDPTLVAGCTYSNPGGGYADVDVVEGSPAQETLVNFSSRVEPARQLKICKIAGAGVAAGTNFTFDFYINNEPEIGAVAVTVPAGDEAQGGNCMMVQGQSAPFSNGFGSFPVNSTVTVVERAAAGTVLSAVSSPGTITGVNLAQRKATIAIVNGVNILTFTNITSAPISAPTSTGTNVSVAPTTNLSLNFGSVSSAGETTVVVVPPDQTPSVPSGFALSNDSPVYQITTSAISSGNITISFDVPNVADAAACSRLRILHYANGVWDAANNNAPQYDAATRVCRVSQTVANLSPLAAQQIAEFLQAGGNSSLFAIAQILAPTAAPVTISGRAVTESGRGIRNAVITLTDSSGTVKIAMTTAFGYYRFTNLAAGETYLLTAQAKRVVFAEPSRILNAGENIQNADFIGFLR